MTERLPVRCRVDCPDPCPEHEKQELGRLAAEHGLQSTRITAALSELAGMGSDICSLLHAVQGGATLVLAGPDPLGNIHAPRFGATLESATGARHASVYGSDLPRLLSDLVANWVKQ